MPAMPFSPCPPGGSCPDVSVGILRRIFGPVIDALASGHIGGAFLDVFEKEPLSPDSRLWELPNVIVSPHTAGHTQGHYAEVGEIFLDNLQRWTTAAELRNRVR